MRATFVSTLLGCAAVCLGAATADAKCERFSYLVNDYGKEGPTRDAKNLLDKHIVKWAAEKGIKNYTVSPKTVKCELFLNFIVFDEHTWTATAQVCWGDGIPESPATPGAAPAIKKPPAAKKAQVPG